MRVSRRHALIGGLAGGMSACASSFDRARFAALAPRQSAAFRHGVASGDPAKESVVLWTRVTTEARSLPVTVEIAEDAAFSVGVRTLSTETDAGRDHTVKVIADGLTPGRTYHYRFSAAGELSPAGRTRTIPENAENARFAVVSCSNYPFGYFNAYDHIARRDDLDAVIHLGDYIYEYGPGGYGSEVGEQLGRQHVPAKEIVDLLDYRQRHAQYKADPGSRAMHAAHPLIAVWDDHETANNAWEKGAENHQPATEGDWNARRRAALQAYYEWMPVRDPEPGRPREALFRSFTWDGFLSLAAIETRLMARTEQLDYSDVVPTLTSQEAIDHFRTEIVADPVRDLLGAPQQTFIEETLRRSVATKEPWRLLANQVIMARFVAPDLTPYVTEEQLTDLEQDFPAVRDFVAFTRLGLPLNLDAWDGYPAARQRFYDMASRAGARDLIVLTGDTHEFWANDLYDDADQRMGVELGTTGVTSPGASAVLGDGAFDYSLLVRRENRDVRYHDPLHRGYIALSLDGDEGRVDYIGLDTILSPNYEASVTARFALRRQDGTVVLDDPKGLGFKERVVL